MSLVDSQPTGRAAWRSVAPLAVLLCMVWAAPLPAAAAAEPVADRRLALLIANEAYRAADTAASLPGKNAHSVADELRHLGFGVDLHENLGRDAMRRAVLAFAAKLQPGDTVVFLFSGYGIQAKGTTWLVPVDADIWSEADVAAQSISLGEIMTAMDEAGARSKLVILDASRRNPFERRFRTLSAGLGPTALPKGSLLVSAADTGKVVSEDEGGSVFIDELLKEMRAPDLTADEIFSRTRIGVARATNGAQRPFVLSSLAEDVYLGPRKGTPLPDQPAQGSTARVEPPPRNPTAGEMFRDCAQCPDVVVLAAGEFTMGSDDVETEKPAHRAVIGSPFAVGRSEVTFAQWDACVEGGGCTYRPSDHGRGRTTLPVGEVSWRDARDYANWLTRVSGHKYRLPTEAEWEYAARAGTTTAFWWGDEARAGLANCRGCGGDSPRESRPVGSFQANPFGLVDTAGNLAEWVEDCWTDSYRPAPSDASSRPAGSCSQRVLRGGSFDAGARYVRSSSRFPYDADSRYYANGFRVVRELTRTERKVRSSR